MAALRLGDQAPGFALPGIDGATHSLSDYEGKPVAVVFSCCHCPYVVAWEDRSTRPRATSTASAGLLVINANAGYLGDSPDDMSIRAEEKGFVLPVPLRRDAGDRERLRRGAHARGLRLRRRAPARLPRRAGLDHQDPSGADPYLRPALDGRPRGHGPAVQETPPVGCTIKWR